MDRYEIVKKKMRERREDLAGFATFIALCLALLALVIIAPIPGLAAERQTVKSGPLCVVKTGHTVTTYWRGQQYETYNKIKKVILISEKKLTAKMLRTRKKKKVLIIEKITGVVLNRRMDGRTSTGNYISYRRLKGFVRPGDKVVTYCIYNPYTKWIDDIVERCDYIR